MDQGKIGAFIAELRNEKNLTQAQLGEKLGVTNKTISRWENGNYMPDLGVIQELCAVLGISANELLCARRLEEAEFKQKADDNLVESMQRIRSIRREKSIVDFLTGAGTGLVVGCLYSPESVRKTVVVFIGCAMLVVGWFRKAEYDKMLLAYLADGEKDKGR